MCLILLQALQGGALGIVLAEENPAVIGEGERGRAGGAGENSGKAGEQQPEPHAWCKLKRQHVPGAATETKCDER